MNPWTSDEDGILLQELTRKLRGYPARTHARLPHRSESACISRLRQLRRNGAIRQPIRPWFPPIQKGRLPPGKASAAKRLRDEDVWV